jgi:hypothetical protein
MVITLYLALFFFINNAWAQDSESPPTQIEQGIDLKTKKVSKLLYVDYMSWQQEGEIKSGTTKSRFLITNKGYCAGGAIGYERNTYRSFVDGCFVFAYGNTGAVKNSITYDQSDISAYGAKASIGIGKFVSSARTEIGFKLPIMYIHQSLTEPRNSSVTEPPPFMAMASLYSRWAFQKWFVQTEFSKFIGNDLVLFAVGGGYDF